MYQIVTDGSCDLEQSLVDQYHLEVVSKNIHAFY